MEPLNNGIAAARYGLDGQHTVRYRRQALVLGATGQSGIKVSPRIGLFVCISEFIRPERPLSLLYTLIRDMVMIESASVDVLP